MSRAALPRWAAFHAVVMLRAKADPEFRARVEVAEGWQRPALANEAIEWAAKKEHVQ